MKNYINEFRNKTAARHFSRNIEKMTGSKTMKIMEICGGHTLTTMKYGLHTLLPEAITLKSGPGCPVCVTSAGYIDTAISLLEKYDVTIASFGDMLRVPGTSSSLLKERAGNKSVTICFSPLDAVVAAEENRDKDVVFLAIGFETTIPGIAVAVREAEKRDIGNISFLTAMKTMPFAMEALLSDPETAIDGFILPGHVTAIMGTGMYSRVIENYTIPCVVSGFEPTDMLQSIEMLVDMINKEEAGCRIQYSRTVKPEGNPVARQIMDDVFVSGDADWRGIGIIPSSGMYLREKYQRYDALEKYGISEIFPTETSGCICGDIMKGKKIPTQCTLFAKLCTPENPVGACMVSAEGACGIYHSYGRIPGR